MALSLWVHFWLGQLLCTFSTSSWSEEVWWRVSRIPLCGEERMEAGKRRTGVGAGTDCREAGHWLSSQGLGLRRELPAPRHPLLLPPGAPWLLSLPAGPLPSQTAARGRGRSISEQRGPCGRPLNARIPFSHGQVRRELTHRHAGSRHQGTPGHGVRVPCGKSGMRSAKGSACEGTEGGSHDCAKKFGV